MPIWNQFRSILFGGAIGAAARTAIEPQIEPARQLAWSNNQNRILELGVLAQLVAEGAVSEAEVLDLAARNGYQVDSLRALTELSLHAPDLALLMQSRRRGELSPAEFNDGLAKLKIKPEFRPALRLLLDSRLTPADVANAVQQGFVPNAGLLPPDPGGSMPYTPPVEEVAIDTLEEFGAGGVPEKRARVLAQLVGLPPGVMELLTMWNRGIITETAVERGVREGHTKTKWTSALKELRWQVLSGRDYAEAWLRGWLTEGEAKAGGLRTGYRAAEMDLLYKNRGRPATPHQVFIGLRRGGALGGPLAGIPPAFVTAVRNSNIRPEYTNLLWAGRFTYPSAFVLRALTQSGDLTQPETEDILNFVGWDSTLATSVSTRWAGGTAGVSAKWADRARSRLFTVAHNEYLDGSIDETQARSLLQQIGAGAAEQDGILALWNAERGIDRLELSPTQIRKAYKKSLYDLPTALAELAERGMTPEDADVFLQSG